MKKVVVFLLFLHWVLCLNAQTVTILNSDFFEKKTYKLSAQVIDSLNNEKLCFVSAYLRHTSDTLITNFALSDADGNIEIDGITNGNYILTVEYLGYLKWQKEIYFRKDTQLGVIKLQPDRLVLDAATISAAGKEVEYRQDTIIFNAGLFKSGSNDNLAALLKRMPGVEISKEGTVTVNGKSVDKITIEGKTFFMNDKSAALNNLPASIVDKVQVIDKDSDAAKISGIKDINKERVMDVKLKDEYKKGFFGNIKLGGGAALPLGQKDEYLEADKALFNGSLMGSYYNEKDQLTVIGNAGNINDKNSMVMVSFGGGGINYEMETLPTSGIHTNFGAGANYNTSRIKNTETTVSAKYNETHVNSRVYTDRTSFQGENRDLNEKESIQTIGRSRGAKVNAEFKNTEGKRFSFTFSPEFNFNSLNSSATSSGNSTLRGNSVNKSSGSTLKDTRYFSTEGDLNASLKFKNNNRRRIGIYANYGFNDGKGFEYTSRKVVNASSGETLQDIDYNKNSQSKYIDASLFYNEPLSDAWTLQLRANSEIGKETKNKDAYDGGIYSNAYSEYTSNLDQSHAIQATAQFAKGTTRMSVGATSNLSQTIVSVTSLGNTSSTGRGDWTFNLSPYLMLSMTSKDKKTNYIVSTSGYVYNPAASKTSPALSINSPTRFSVGNIYLKPYNQQNIVFNTSGSTKKQQSFNVSIYAILNNKGISNAIWYDGMSNMYSVPINVKDPGVESDFYGSFSTPLTKDGQLKFSLSMDASFNATTSYQSNGIKDGFKADNFDYEKFMADFWGSADGDIFYSGKSGFIRSRTFSTRINLRPSLKLNIEDFILRAGVAPRLNMARYSFDPKANTTTLDVNYTLEASYETPHGFELSTDFNCRTFYGYRDLFNKTIFMWDFSLTKSIKAFTIELDINDILNQGRDRSAVWTDNYSQYTYSNSFGRHIMLSVKYNFGKMNASRSDAARRASMRLAF